MIDERREFSDTVRKWALLRAKDRCEQCGSKGPLQFHHIGHRADRSAFNCRVLCIPCHNEVHKNANQLERR